MVIFFSGNSFKYEIEAVMKLFVPIDSFDFIFDDLSAAYQIYKNSSDDITLIRMRKTDKDTFLRSAVRMGGKVCVRSARASFDVSDADARRTLCSLLYDCLHELTGISPRWGLITGIRPVKQINKLISDGLSHDEIVIKLHNECHTSERKIDLAYSTAITQAPALGRLKDNSFSLYVSIPFCPSRCSYCSFVSHSIESASAKKLMNDYVDKLCEEIRETGSIMSQSGMTLDTVYIGGGTPTTLSEEQIAKIMGEINQNFNLSSICEYTVEAGRSDTITKEKLMAIKENCRRVPVRISINPQTMDNNVLAAIGRKHTAEQMVDAFMLARSCGFNNINTDTVAGLPTDTADGFMHTIDELIRLSPESITVHALTLKRSADMFVSGRNDALCSPVSQMVDYAQSKLMSNNYSPYYLYRQKNTIDNLENVGYAVKGYECLYNIYIMEEIQTIIAVGAGASTKLVNRKDGRITRCFNYKYPYEYNSRFDSLMQKRRSFFEESGIAAGKNVY